MTDVTFFEDYHCFEFHAPHGARRCRYYLFSPVYECKPFSHCVTSAGPLANQPAVYSSDFIPLRLSPPQREP